MTSKDIQQKSFKSRMGGYNSVEVDSFLDEVAAQMDSLTAQNETLAKELAEAKAQLDKAQKLENTLRDTLIGAQLTANAITQDAKLQAQRIVEDAQKQADDIIGQAKVGAKNALANAHEIRKLIADYQKKIRSVMAGQLDVMEQYFVDIGEEE